MSPRKLKVNEKKMTFIIISCKFKNQKKEKNRAAADLHNVMTLNIVQSFLGWRAVTLNMKQKKKERKDAISTFKGPTLYFHSSLTNIRHPSIRYSLIQAKVSLNKPTKCAAAVVHSRALVRQEIRLEPVEEEVLESKSVSF